MRLSTILFELYKYRPKITFEHENIRMENISNESNTLLSQSGHFKHTSLDSINKLIIQLKNESVSRSL